MEGFHFDRARNTLWIPNSARGMGRDEAFEKAVKYFEQSPESYSTADELRARKSARYNRNGMSKGGLMRDVGTIPTFIYHLVVNLTKDPRFWQDNRNRDAFFQKYSLFRT